MKNVNKRNLSIMKKKQDTLFSLSAEQQLLVEQHTSMAMKLGKKYRNSIKDPALTMEDLGQEACLGLCQAAAKFNPQNGVAFETYAYAWCLKYVIKAVGREMVMSEMDVELLTDEEEEEDDAELRLTRLNQAMKKLSPMERKVVSYAHGLHGEPMGFREIGRKLNLSAKRVQDIYENAMIQLEQTL